LRCVGFFLSFRDGIVERYPEVFGGGNNEESQNSTGFGEKWGWYQHIHSVAGGSVFKIDDAVSLPLNKALLFLAFEKDKNDETIKNMKRTNESVYNTNG